MPDAPLVIFVVTIALALTYAYANGANDAANAGMAGMYIPCPKLSISDDP